MKHLYDDYLLLSAYLDDELTDNEKQYIENKLKSSVDLQNKLQELKRIKNLVSNSKDLLPENDYFDQRIFSALLDDKPKVSPFINWATAIGIATAAIIVFFTFNINPDFFRNIIFKHDNFRPDYTERLRPLFLASEISNEDLFNFALYEEIPLNNSEKQVLKIGFDPSGNEYFELKKANYQSTKDNLNIFLSKLNLTSEKKSKIDSLLQNYAVQLSKHILVTEDNSIAINPIVWNIRKAMVADIVSLTRQLDKKNFDRLANTHKLLIPKNVIAWNKTLDSIQTNKFIIFTPDSVFTSELTYEINQFAISGSLNKERNVFRFYFDSTFNFRDSEVKVIKSPDFVQVQVEKIEIPDIQIPNFNSLIELIEKSTQKQPNLNLVTKNNSNKEQDYQQRRQFIPPLNDINLDSILEAQERRFNNFSKDKSDKDKQIQNNSTNNPGTETKENNSDEIIIQLEKLREEIERFRKQFHNFLREDSSKQKSTPVFRTNDNIEI
jgi:hypothetical protein